MPVSIWEPAKRSCSNTLNVWYSIERGDTVTPPRRVLLPEWFLVHDATDTHPTESGPDSQLEWLSEPDYEIGDAMTGGGRSVSCKKSPRRSKESRFTQYLRQEEGVEGVARIPYRLRRG